MQKHKNICKFFLNKNGKFNNKYYFIKDISLFSHNAKENIIMPSLSYKCFSIKNLGLTSSVHMHILAPLQLKIFIFFDKIRYLEKCRYIRLFDEKVVNDDIKEEFKLLYKNYFNYCRKLVNLFFIHIKKKFKHLTDEDCKIMKEFLGCEISDSNEILNFEYKLAMFNFEEESTSSSDSYSSEDEYEDL